MKIVLQIAVIFCVLLLSSCSRKSEDEEKSMEMVISEVRTFGPDELATELKRDTLRKVWLADAKRVAEKSGDKQALLVSKFLQKNNILAEPDPRGIRFLEGAGANTNWFAIVPLIQGDERLGPNVESYTSPDDPAFAYFVPDQRAMILKSHVKISPLWRGIMTLHEGNHALVFIRERYDWHDHETFCEKERDTHNFQNRVTMKIGGMAYRTFLESLIAEIKMEVEKKGLPIEFGVWHRTRHFPELETIFEPSESNLERDARESSVWIHAYFSIFEESFGKNAEEHKALFLKTVYLDNHILQK